MDTKSIIGMVDKEDYFIQLLDLEHIISTLDPKSAEELWSTSIKADKEYKALVADDSPTIRKILDKHLTQANFQVSVVNNGEEAMNFLIEMKSRISEDQTLSEILDIVICDIEMPLMDGFTVTKNIKEDPVLETLPVILYSSIITDELRHKGESVGADSQVSKPDLDKMAEMAIKLIKERSV